MVVNISIDDLEPKFGDMRPLHAVIDAFPDVKFDIFIPVNTNWGLDWWRSRWPTWTSYILEHHKWCERISNLPSENVEIAIHGYYHHILNGAPHGEPEFLHFNKEQAMDRLLLCEEVLTKAGIPFVRGFRPPRWFCSQGTIDALEELNYLFYAPSPRPLEKTPTPPTIPSIFYNAYVDGTMEKTSPCPPDKYCLLRGHYQMIDWPLMESYKYLISRLQDMQQKEELVFKFYTEIAEDKRGEKG